MPELKGIGYLKGQLNNKSVRVRTRYRYYEMKNSMEYFSKVIPEKYRWMSGVLGWSAKAVDSLADRLCFREFRNDNFALNEIYQMNNADILFDSAALSALISSCCFIYISPDADGYPRLQVIDGGNATGRIDPITGLLYEGYAVLKRSDAGSPIEEAYFEPGKTTYYRSGTGDGQNMIVSQIVQHDVDYPLLVPIIFRPDAVRPFGHSRISRACMQLQQGALRTVMRSEVTAEFYSFPQKYVTGLADDAEMDTYKATISSFLHFSKDEDGDAPKLGQFSAANMSPHVEQLKMFASMFAGETGLTMDDMGFPTDNPSSSEAIKAAHENLRLAARKAQRTFGSGFLNAGYLAACLRDEFAYQRRQLYLTTPTWAPVFEPDASTLSLIGDGLIKFNQAVPGYMTEEKLKDLTGY